MGDVERFSGFVVSTIVRVRLEENDRLRLLVGRQAQIMRYPWCVALQVTCGSGRGWHLLSRGVPGCASCVL
jgi:hypothetical protein